MKISKFLLSLALVSTITFNTNASVSSSVAGATTIVIVANHIINKNQAANSAIPDEVREAVAFSALSTVGAIAGLTLLTTHALNFLSSNQKSDGLSSLMDELRKDENLQDKTDEELAYMIIEANE